MKKYRVKKCTTLDYAEGKEVIHENEILYGFTGCTYGCISSDGIAVTEEQGKEPFFEMPKDSLEEIDSTPNPRA